jgi:hypothetical protein
MKNYYSFPKVDYLLSSARVMIKPQFKNKPGNYVITYSASYILSCSYCEGEGRFN